MREAKELLETIHQCAEDLDPLGNEAPMRTIERQINNSRDPGLRTFIDPFNN
jgi:hypothetical protein